MDNLTGSMKDVAFATSPREFDLSYSTTLEEIMEKLNARRAAFQMPFQIKGGIPGQRISVSYTHLALPRKLLVQRVQLGKLSHAGIASGEPEIHDSDGVAGEQFVALYHVPIQVFALKGGKLLHTAVIGCRHHIAVHCVVHNLRVRFLQRLSLIHI